MNRRSRSSATHDTGSPALPGAAIADPIRRRLLQGGWSLCLLALAPLPAGIRSAFAAPVGKPGERPRDAFRAETLTAALDALGVASAAPDARLRLGAPAKAENGAVVPLKVECEGGFSAVNILCAGNPVPMIARFECSPRVKGHLSTRIKMGESADITVVSEAADGAQRADLWVEVTIGGCN